MNIGIFLFGISIVLTFYHRTIFYQINLFDLSNILYAVLYIASSASVFFLPLYFVHVKMKEEKYKTLEIISDNYERIERKETPMFFELNNEFIEKISSTKNLFDIAKQFPVFPFNYKNIYSFLITIIIPILLFIFQIIISRVVFAH